MLCVRYIIILKKFWPFNDVIFHLFPSLFIVDMRGPIFSSFMFFMGIKIVSSWRINDGSCRLMAWCFFFVWWSGCEPMNTTADGSYKMGTFFFKFVLLSSFIPTRSSLFLFRFVLDFFVFIIVMQASLPRITRSSEIIDRPVVYLKNADGIKFWMLNIGYWYIVRAHGRD